LPNPRLQRIGHKAGLSLSPTLCSKEEQMKLRAPNGNMIESAISKGRNIVLTMVGTTPAKTKAELEEYIREKSKEKEKLEDYEIVEATEHERSLLREGNFKMKGL